MSLSAHLVEDYEKSHQTRQQNIMQSGAMEYNSLAHGHGALSVQQTPAFSQFSQASLAPAYASDTAGPSNLGMTRIDAPVTFQQIQMLQQQRDEAQALRTAQQIAALQAKLNQKLGPEYISQRPGPGGGPKLTYAEGWKIINLANEVFGFNGWSSSITSLTVDYIDFNQESQRYNVGVTAIVRVLLRDGVSHEDIGYGLLENCKSKGMALDKCKKEAVTDALKRTLRNFGNVLGNCLYDKEYTKEILKMRMPQPPKMEAKDLHRRKEFAESNQGASTSGVNATHPPMAPPPVPVRPVQQSAAPPPRANNPPKSEPMSLTAQRIASALAEPTPKTNPAPHPPSRPIATAPPNAVPGPSHPSKMPETATLKRAGTDEALYTFGSDDDSMFADLSFNASDFEAGAENAEQTVDFTDHSIGGIDFTDRSRLLPSAAPTFDPAPRPVLPSVAVAQNVQNLRTSGPRKMSTETKNKILEGLLDSEPRSPAAPAVVSPPATVRVVNSTSTTTPSAKRSSSGGGFAIPPGISRPQRTSYPPPPVGSENRRISGGVGTGSHLPPNRDASTSGLGSKRTSEALGLSPFGGGGIASARSVLSELEVERDGSVKRPRLS